MSDDIVTQLRNTQIGGILLCSEAADEIERLQKLLVEAEQEIKTVRSLNSALSSVLQGFYNMEKSDGFTSAK